MAVYLVKTARETILENAALAWRKIEIVDKKRDIMTKVEPGFHVRQAMKGNGGDI